jgi:hypothetical protein
VDELGRMAHYHRKSMVTAFFFGTGECFPNILPRNRSMETKYFAEEIVSGLENVCIPKGEIRTKEKIFFILTMHP